MHVSLPSLGILILVAATATALGQNAEAPAADPQTGTAESTVPPAGDAPPLTEGSEESNDGAAVAAASSAFGPFERIVVIPIEGTIDGALATSLERRVAEAEADGADCIVFQINTYGGEVFAAEKITDLIFPLPPRTEGDEGIHTIAYVEEKAISAGALIAFSCREIFMEYGSRMGDCEPITMASDGVQTLPEKFQSPLRAKFRTFAQRNGYPVAIAEAMVTKELGVTRIRFEGENEAAYYTILETQTWSEEKRDRIESEQVILLEGQLPTFNDAESIEHGLSRGTVRDRAELLQRLGAPAGDDGAPVLDMNWSEELVRFLQAWKFIFFIIGVVALYLEFKTPGLGVPGVVGVLAMAIVFGSSYLAGLAETWEILLFIAGLGLLAVEIFVFPGFGIPGVLGLFLMLIAFYLASQPFVIPDPSKDTPSAPFEMQMFESWMMQFGISLLVALVLIVVLARWLPKASFMSWLVLEPVVAKGPKPGAPAAAPPSNLLGESGTALTKLRPAGRATIGNRRFEVTTRGGYIEAGEAIEVCEVHGNRVVVRKRIS